jgi:hypothetical protein
LRKMWRDAVNNAAAIRAAVALFAVWSAISGASLLVSEGTFQQAAYAGFRVMSVSGDVWGFLMLLISAGLWLSVPGSHTRTTFNSLVAFFASIFWLMFGLVLTLGAASRGITSANGIWDIFVGAILMIITSLWPRFRYGA